MKPTCTHEWQILAVFLDGATGYSDSSDGVSKDGISSDGDPGLGTFDGQHLRNCPDCQRALRRGRRLDAILANHSSIEVDDELADRLFAAALPVTAPATSTDTPTTARRLGWTTAALATLMLGTGIGVGLWIAGGRQPAALTTTPHPNSSLVQQVATSITSSDPTTIQLPDRGARRIARGTTGRGKGRWNTLPWKSPGRSGPARPLDLLRQTEHSTGLTIGAGVAIVLRAMANPLSGPLPTSAQLHHEASELARMIRLDAGLRLLRSHRDIDRRGLVSYLGTAPDDRVAFDLLEAVRNDRTCTRWLRRRLEERRPDAALLLGAARIGTLPIDLALRRAVRRDSTLITALVDAVHRTSARPLGARLLLDLWATLESRSDPDPSRVRAWFRKLPGDATEQLIAIVRTTPSHPDRRRCLLALAWRRDLQALPYMLELVNDNHHENSLAAGFVLSQLRVEAAAAPLHAELGASRRPYVVLAALLGMGSQLAHEYTRTAELTPEEADFLRTGRFTASQFSIAARMCKRRQLLAD